MCTPSGIGVFDAQAVYGDHLDVGQKLMLARSARIAAMTVDPVATPSSTKMTVGLSGSDRARPPRNRSWRWAISMCWRWISSATYSCDALVNASPSSFRYASPPSAIVRPTGCHFSCGGHSAYPESRRSEGSATGVPAVKVDPGRVGCPHGRISVPAVPRMAASTASRVVMTAGRPVAATNVTALAIFGSIDPGAKVPSRNRARASATVSSRIACWLLAPKRSKACGTSVTKSS